MKSFVHNKLWRDKLAEMVSEEGSVVYIDNIDEDQYEEALRAKIVEESIEMLESVDQDDVMEEMADSLEVMDALCKVYGITMDDIKKIKDEKFEDLGGYSKSQLITHVEHPAGSAAEKYCLENPEQYPEMEDEEA
jgi:predicted house-cleaning noncanonical NTP pyrophosphatase (MazG superfamily)